MKITQEKATKATKRKTRNKKMNSDTQVLVICSDADLQDLYQEILWKCGISHIEQTTNVSDSLKRMKDIAYDLIVLDCKKPNGDIVDITKAASSKTKILCIASEIEKKRDINIPFLIKPFKINKFVNKVADLGSR